MARAKWLRLTASEKRIWESAYAAAFVRTFHDELADRRGGDKSATGTFDATMAFDKAEEAETVADASIAQLRRRREQGSQQRGAPSKVDAAYIETDEEA